MPHVNAAKRLCEAALTLLNYFRRSHSYTPREATSIHRRRRLGMSGPDSGGNNWLGSPAFYGGFFALSAVGSWVRDGASCFCGTNARFREGIGGLSVGCA
jgi:hypothetical protein